MTYTYRQFASAQRQAALWAFVRENDLACFSCGTRDPRTWGKTGESSSGRPWAICLPCIKQKKEDQAA